MLYNILVVEDEDGWQKNYEFLLSKDKKYKLFFAGNREEAYHLLERFRIPTDGSIPAMDKLFAVAILDQNLGKADSDPVRYREDWSQAGGIAIVPDIKYRSPCTRIIIFTAYKGTDEDKGFEAATFGANAYLSKIDIGDESASELFRRRIADEIKRFEIEYNKLLNKSS